MNHMLTKPIYLALFAILLISGGAFAYYQNNGPRPEEHFKLHTVAKGEVSQSVSANGTLNPVTLVNVGTQVSGIVKKLYVDFNDKVEKGQVLLELDDALLSAQVKQSQANVQNADAALELAQANEARLKSLFAQEYVSRQELDQAVHARKSAQAQGQLARAQQEKDRANLSFSVIRSPVSGVVVARNVDVGQTVAASFQTPTLFQIAQDLSKMQIDSSFSEADIGNIRVGQAVRFNVDAYPNRSIKGGVRQVRLNPSTTQNVVTYNVVVEVDNPEQILMPGMTAYLNIVVFQRKGALLVPNAALRFKPSLPPSVAAGKNEDKPAKRKKDSASGTVYILENGNLKPVSVTLGITDNRNTEVTGGELKAGDQVVTGEALAGADAPGKSSSSMRMRMF